MNKFRVYINRRYKNLKIKKYYANKEIHMQTKINTLFQQGIHFANQHAYDAAVKCFETILKYDPDRIDAIINSGLMHYYAGRFDIAEKYIHLSLNKRPNSADSYYYLGLIYKAAKNIPDAMASYQLALNCNPNYELAWYNFGEILLNKKNYTLAIKCFKNVISISPNFEDAYLNLGESYSRMEHFYEAIQFFKQLLKINPNHTNALYNMGVAYNGLREYKKALLAYDKALSIDPGHVKSHYNKSFILLAGGDYVNGFAEYEWRLKKHKTYKCKSKQPMWNGDSIPSKKLLVYAEQGFGDCLQFIRFLPLVQKKVKTIILECQPELLRLFSDLNEVDQIVPRGNSLPDHDFQISLLSLGDLLNITLDNLPATIPYLKGDYPLPKEIPNYFDKKQKIKIGIVWGGTGSTLKKTDMGRSLSLKACQKLLDMNQFQWFSFQKGARSIELKQPPGNQLIDLGKYFNDFADTARAACEMDLIITVDTAMAHLSGALGLSVWTLLSYDADWRWPKKLNHSPWYPGMKLFWQESPGDWESMIEQVQTSLVQEFSGR
jgi:tetratricopeptide (TPR) repeat protein